MKFFLKIKSKKNYDIKLNENLKLLDSIKMEYRIFK